MPSPCANGSPRHERTPAEARFLRAIGEAADAMLDVFAERATRQPSVIPLPPVRAELTGPRCYGVADVAERLGISERAVREFIASRELRAAKLGARVVVSEDDLKGFIEAHKDQ